MSSKLFEKYFPIEDQVEDELEREAARDNRERLSSLIASSGWPLFKSRMEIIIEEAMNITPGTEQAMLYQIGKKDGLMDIRALMNQIEREIIAGRNDA